MGQMQRETFVEVAVKHPEVLGRKVTADQARQEWPRLRDHDELAIRATAYHLKDLMDQLPSNMSAADKHRMAAVGYNIGPKKMLEQVEKNKLGYDAYVGHRGQAYRCIVITEVGDLSRSEAT